MARFITGARFLAGPMAGAAGMNFWRFLGWNVLGALVWCGVMVAIGYLVVDGLWRAIATTQTAGQLAALAVVLILIALYFVWRHEHGSAGKANN
jgi:membrane protein DedA with SNARE-associated domain